MKAICRVNKITAQGSARGKTDHNYRLREVANADKERSSLNREYVNIEQTPIWELCHERIKDAGIKRAVRADAVRGIEFILTASPEYFKKDAKGLCQDVRGNEWLMANLKFMKERYGKNLVAFTLHQDEKTPHVHAIVVPITPENRLSAKTLFNPKTLRQLQTDYARAMKPLGLERGVEYSTAIHQDMRKLYGAEKQAYQLVDTPIEIQKPKLLDLLSLDKWKKQQEEKANSILAQAQKQALENIKLQNEIESLKKRLETSEGLKQGNFKELTQAKKSINDFYLSVALDKTDILKEKGNKIREQIFKDLREDLKKAALSIYGGLNPLDKSMKTLVAGNNNYTLRLNQNNEIIGFNLKHTNVFLNMQTITKEYEKIQTENQLQQNQAKEQKRDRGNNLGL
jgi:hypothetical protein